MTYPHRAGADLMSAAPADYDDVLLSVRLDDAIASIRAELPRAEAQATSTLQLCSGLTVAGLALLTTGRLHGTAADWGWTAIALLGTAILSCLTTLRPRLSGQGPRFGFPRWARLTGQQLVDELHAAPATDSPEENLTKAHQTCWLARTARRKFRAVQTAQALLLLALAAGVVAACTAGR